MVALAQGQGLSLRANMAWNAVGSIGRLACNYLITIAVVRLSHGFDAAGALALAMAISNLVTPFADFRLRTIQVTDVDGERTAGAYVGLRLCTTVLALVIGLGYALATSGTRALSVILLYLLYSLAATLIEVLHAVLQRHRRMDVIGRSYLMQGVSTLVVFCAALWWTNSLDLAVGLMAVATAAVGLVYALPRAARFERLRPELDLRGVARILGTLLPLVLAQVCSSSVLTIPRQYLAATAGAAALGIYASVASPAVIVQMGAAYVYSPLMTEFAERFRSDKRSALHLLRRTTLGIIGVTSVFSVLLLLLGKPILFLMYGAEITRYTYLLLPAVLCTFTTAFAWFMNDLLLALRDFKASFLGNVAATVVTLLCYRFMVDTFGMNGVSWGGVVSYAVAVIVLALFLVVDYRRLETSPRPGAA
ncbi:lipopolysaccharide biosynthesis protein [Actinomyces radicidentis]|nr:polysaccharide biosynthesis protein [Actinomyces radicidentis]